VFPTFLNLRKLAAHAHVAEALAAAARTPIVTVLPEVLEQDAGGHRRMRIPEEAGYGGAVFEINLPSS
jgi:hypothetical protein